MTRVVIPIGPKRPLCLPYVIRSLVLNAGVTEVVTVGERPIGIEPDLHIDSPNRGKPAANVAGHLKLAAEQVGGQFIWCDDDTFTITPWEPGVYVRPFSIAKMLRENPNRGAWSDAVRKSIEVMKAKGFDPEKVPAGTVHRPWLVKSDRVLRTLQDLDGGSFKALYVAGLRKLIVAGDAKLVGRGVPMPDASVISVYHDSWRYSAGRMIRDMFAEPTRWETAPPEVSVMRGPRRHRHR